MVNGLKSMKFLFGFTTLETDDLVNVEEITKIFDGLVTKEIDPVKQDVLQKFLKYSTDIKLLDTKIENNS